MKVANQVAACKTTGKSFCISISFKTIKPKSQKPDTVTGRLNLVKF